MKTNSESPRYILILGSLFLFAYVAYNLGVAWMDSLPPEPVAMQAETPTLTPTVFLTPTITPTDLPLAWITPTLNQIDPNALLHIVEEGETCSQIAAVNNVSVASILEQNNLTKECHISVGHSLLIPYPTQAPPEMNNSNSPYPEPQITNTPTVVIPTATLEQLPPTSVDDPYPGPEVTVTPTGGPQKTEGPYPDPEIKPTTAPSLTHTPEQEQVEPTLTPLATSPAMELTPTETQPTATELPLLTTMPYSETQVVSNAAIQQVIWLQKNNQLSLATSKGLYQYNADDLKIISILDSSSFVLSNQVAFNDEIAISGGNDGVLRWWDLESQGYLGALNGHFLGVPHLKVPTFGAFLASGGDDAVVKIWNIANFYNLGVDSIQLTHTFRDSITRITDLAVSPNGDLVVAASQRHVHVWNPQTGQLQKTIHQPDGWYTAVAFNSTGQMLATAYDGKKLEFWDTFTWERTDFIPLPDPVKSLTYSPDGFYLAIGFEDNYIQIWDVRTMLLRAELVVPPDFTSFEFNPIGSHLVTCSDQGTIRVWDLMPLFRIE